LPTAPTELAAGRPRWSFNCQQQAGVNESFLQGQRSDQRGAANDVQATIVDSPGHRAHQSGRLRALAVTAGKRASALPDVPTMMEAGVADYDISGWAGLFAPAGTPKPIVSKLTQQTMKTVQMPDFRAKLLAMGSEPVGGSGAELAAIMKVQIQKFKAVAKTANIKAQ
jgi:tripartite-type tricarboxylate transporter receptor subunit TctC